MVTLLLLRTASFVAKVAHLVFSNSASGARCSGARMYNSEPQGSTDGNASCIKETDMEPKPLVYAVGCWVKVLRGTEEKRTKMRNHRAALTFVRFLIEEGHCWPK